MTILLEGHHRARALALPPRRQAGFVGIREPPWRASEHASTITSSRPSMAIRSSRTRMAR